jgi:hypothetical protein
MIDQAWSGAIGPDGLALSVESEPFCRMLAHVWAAIGVLSATAAEVTGRLTSRQCAEVVGEVLSRGGYHIDMADLAIMSAGADEGVYLYAAERMDVGSFLYVGQSDPKVGAGLIRDIIGVVDDGSATVSIFATTCFVASGTDEHRQSVTWHLAPRDYVILKGWLNARWSASDGKPGT